MTIQQMLLGTGGGGASITDYTAITTLGETAFSYFAMPSGPRTMLNYISSFGINQNSQNDNTGNWPNGFDSINATATPISSNNYFDSGNVRIIRGDNSSDGPDWVIFYFKGALGDFDGYNNDNGSAWFAGEDSYSAATNGNTVSEGRIWGFDPSAGWTLLYYLNCSSNGSNHQQTNWWSSGGTVTSSYGKYSPYDSASITHFGFSVS
tara:strand:- start:1 stop:621 length:621 start_codon:yes stop_codon:yes gene_type:complete